MLVARTADHHLTRSYKAMAHTPNNMPFEPDRSSDDQGEEKRTEGTQEDEEQTTSIFQRVANDVRDRYRKALDRLAE